MKRILIALLAICFLAVAFPAIADDPLCTRPHTWTAKQRFAKDVEMKSGSDMEFKTGSKVTIEDGADFDIETPADHSKAIYESATSPTATAGVGYVIAGTEGNVFFIGAQPQVDVDECEYGVGPDDGAGVTVVLPTPTEALGGWESTYIKHDSGGTDVFLTVSGTSGMYAIDSGTTDGTIDSGTFALDAQWDYITVQLVYIDSGASRYIIKERGIDGVNK